MIVTIDEERYPRRFLIKDVPLRMTHVMHGIMGARHVRNTDDWTVWRTWPALHMIRTDLGKTAEFSEVVKEWAADEYENILELFRLQTASSAAGNASLLPLQRVGTAYILAAQRAILGDDLGSGKTPMTCDALQSLPHKAILITCPKTLFKTWERHIHEWTSDITPIIATDSAAKRRKAIAQAVDLIAKGRRVALIINYESAWRHSRLVGYGNLHMEKCEDCDPQALLPVEKSKCETCLKELNDVAWEVVICDEAHRIINVSKQTRGLWYLSQEAEYVWALTGTPSRGRVSDFWSLLHLIDPVAWSSKSKFMDRYCVSDTDNWGNIVEHGIKMSMKSEFEQVTAQYMIRRTFAQIMAAWDEHRGIDHVPTEIHPEERFVELTPKQRSLYNDIADSMFVELDDGRVILSENGLTRMTRLLQVSSSMIAVDDEDRVTMVSPSPKVNELLDIIRDAAPEPIVVFCVNRDLVELARAALVKEGISVSVVHGKVDDRDREIANFQEGKTDVFVGTYAAASEGITLTRSHVTVFMQRHWSMILNKQAEGRTFRYGQESKRIVYIDVVAEDTVESRVHERYADNLDGLESVVQDAMRGNAKTLRELVTGKK